MGFKLDVTIHHVGKTKGTLSTASSAKSPHRVPRRPDREERGAVGFAARAMSAVPAPGADTSAGGSVVVAGMTSDLMEDPPLARLPLHERQDEDDEEQQHGDRAGVPELVEPKGLFADEGGAAMTRRAAR
ncbi:hypothetical protein [Isoptericola variabilis]|uniref:hypothetical protein n=1 Tax=Isoptericola variabilis TaxID=139208 RepID=UPI001641035E|nr:hypothetical protein [Isoptericola variabilis]